MAHNNSRSALVVAITLLYFISSSIAETCMTKATSSDRGCDLTLTQIQSILDICNAARQNVNATDMNALEWSNTLADDACTIVNSSGTKTGNTRYVHLNVKSVHGTINPVDTVNSWQRQKAYYTYSSSCKGSSSFCGTCSKANSGCDPYVQMIWAKTSKIGCARHYDSSTNVAYFTCGFSPAGLSNGVPPYTEGTSNSGCIKKTTGDDNNDDGKKKDDGGDSKRPWWHYAAMGGAGFLLFFGGGMYFYLDGGCCDGDDDDDKKKKKRRKKGKDKIGATKEELKDSAMTEQFV